ncbi:MAG: hypothetical protein KF831_06700 [Acidobacteria bacterium]|nr:hypothetical protein [Acidobacteriota bacterium]
MPKNKIEDLRNLLFETIEKLVDGDETMNADQANAVANIAKTIIDSARVEIQFMNIVGGTGSGFIPTEPRQLSGGNKRNGS